MIMELLSAELDFNFWDLRGPKALSVYHPEDTRFDPICTQNPGIEDNVRMDVFATLLDGGSPPIPDGWHPAAVNFISLCFIKDPEKRPKVMLIVLF